MNPSLRVGVVEIGSRAVRLLVADVQPGQELNVIATDWAESGLVAALGSESEEEVLSQVGTTAFAFAERCRTLDSKRICIFGTGALRQLSVAHIERLQEQVPDLIVLDSTREAECSLLAAIIGMQFKGDVVAVDQGAATMEVAVGRFTSRKLQVKAAASYPLGTHPLVASLAKLNGDLQRFQSDLKKKIAVLGLPHADSAQPILLGSAATKLGWLNVRRRLEDRYDPRLVHGTEMAVNQIDQLIVVAEQYPDSVRRLVDPHRPDSSEYETVITGLIALRLVLQKLDASNFAVSAFGTRHGMALQLVHNNTNA